VTLTDFSNISSQGRKAANKSFLLFAINEIGRADTTVE